MAVKISANPGIYTEITDINAPGSAVPGATVHFIITVRNNSDADIIALVSITNKNTGDTFDIGGGEFIPAYGGLFPFETDWQMLSVNTHLRAAVWYTVDYGVTWHADAWQDFTITTAPPTGWRTVGSTVTLAVSTAAAAIWKTVGTTVTLAVAVGAAAIWKEVGTPVTLVVTAGAGTIWKEVGASVALTVTEGGEVVGGSNWIWWVVGGGVALLVAGVVLFRPAVNVIVGETVKAGSRAVQKYLE